VNETSDISLWRNAGRHSRCGKDHGFTRGNLFSAEEFERGRCGKGFWAMIVTSATLTCNDFRPSCSALAAQSGEMVCLMCGQHEVAELTIMAGFYGAVEVGIFWIAPIVVPRFRHCL